jgi:hypothetical protein
VSKPLNLSLTTPDDAVPVWSVLALATDVHDIVLGDESTMLTRLARPERLELPTF